MDSVRAIGTHTRGYILGFLKDMHGSAKYGYAEWPGQATRKARQRW